MCSPSGFAGPQPQQALFGAYFSWSDLSLIVEISQAAQPRFFCQRVEDSAFHLRIRKGGSASPKTMPSPIAEGAIFFRFRDSIYQFIRRVQTSSDKDAIRAQRKVSVA
jgi:hypothetical protein